MPLLQKTEELVAKLKTDELTDFNILELFIHIVPNYEDHITEEDDVILEVLPDEDVRTRIEALTNNSSITKLNGSLIIENDNRCCNYYIPECLTGEKAHNANLLEEYLRNTKTITDLDFSNLCFDARTDPIFIALEQNLSIKRFITPVINDGLDWLSHLIEYNQSIEEILLYGVTGTECFKFIRSLRNNKHLINLGSHMNLGLIAGIKDLEALENLSESNSRLKKLSFMLPDDVEDEATYNSRLIGQLIKTISSNPQIYSYDLSYEKEKVFEQENQETAEFFASNKNIVSLVISVPQSRKRDCLEKYEIKFIETLKNNYILLNFRLQFFNPQLVVQQFIEDRNFNILVERCNSLMRNEPILNEEKRIVLKQLEGMPDHLKEKLVSNIDLKQVKQEQDFLVEMSSMFDEEVLSKNLKTFAGLKNYLTKKILSPLFSAALNENQLPNVLKNIACDYVSDDIEEKKESAEYVYEITKNYSSVRLEALSEEARNKIKEYSSQAINPVSAAAASSSSSPATNLAHLNNVNQMER